MKQPSYHNVGAKQPVHSFHGGKGLGIQQGTSLWFGSSKSYQKLVFMQAPQSKMEEFTDRHKSQVSKRT